VQLKDKAVVITGASSGIGRATALALGREKARLFLVARRQVRLEEVAGQIRESGGAAFIHAADLRNRETAESIIPAAYESLGRIDVLINNAAFGYFGTIERMPSEVAQEIFSLNLHGPLAAIQRVIPIMREQGSGHIINVSSVAGKRGLPLSGIYCATKFALNGLSEALRLELRDAGIHVSLIHPTYTKSEFQEALRRGEITRSYAPVGRVQTSEEVAEAIVGCIRRPRIEVYPHSPSRFIAWACAVAPSLVDKVLVRAFRERLKG
jgi:short-subunit dehydrogenase